MIIREVTVGELVDFIRSEEYLKLDPKPITPLRAVSQAKNPKAQPHDTALIYIAENDTTLAFAGILPDLAEVRSTRVYSNSGWWVHPEMGRKYGLPVFMKAFRKCKQRMFFTDCSEYTKELLEHSGLFEFHKPVQGKRYFLRAYTGEVIKKKGYNNLLSKPFSVADTVFNALHSFRLKLWMKKYKSNDYTVCTEKILDEKLKDFIGKHSGGYYLRQEGEKLNWIIQNPWITTESGSSVVPFPFSQFSGVFWQTFLVVQKKDEIVAVFMISIRDNHASLPYIYFNEKYLEHSLIAAMTYMYRIKVNSLIVFREEVVNVLEKIQIPAVMKRNISRYTGYSMDVSELFGEDKIFQDGEGDVAFT